MTGEAPQRDGVGQPQREDRTSILPPRTCRTRSSDALRFISAVLGSAARTPDCTSGWPRVLSAAWKCNHAPQGTAIGGSGGFSASAVSETRKLAAILVTDVVGFSRLAGADEDRILARLRTLRSDLIDPTIAVHHGRVVKRTGDGSVVEFRSVV